MASREDTPNGEWTTIIKPKTGLLNLDLMELLNYKFLMFLFVRRDFVAQFKQTILGPLWFIIKPVMTSGIFTILFSVIAKIPTDGVPPFLFNLAGVTLWSYFADCLNSTSNILGGNAGIFGKVYFPRLTVPISTVVTKLYAFGIQLAFFMVVYMAMLLSGAQLSPNLWLFALPLVVAQAALLGMGFGLVSSALTVKYRDLLHLVSFGVQLWMYITPVAYPLSQVPDNLKIFVLLNPMTALVEIFRYGFTGVGTVPVMEWGISTLVTGAILFVGLIVYHRAERNFVDVA